MGTAALSVPEEVLMRGEAVGAKGFDRYAIAAFGLATDGSSTPRHCASKIQLVTM
jgi:hypothetical protein